MGPGLLALLLTAVPRAAEPAGDGKPLRAGYLEVLAGYAASADESASVAALCSLEEAYHGGSPSAIRPLKARQRAVARHLADIDAGVLVPALSLHAAAFEEHFAEGRFTLAGHSREVAIDLAEIAGRALPAGAERTLVADALVLLADHHTRERMFFHSEALLRKALEVDPGHVAAHLLLGIHHEWLGRFAAARDALRGLVAVDPAHREGRLRLVVNLERCGELEESARLARQLVEEPVADWVLTVAYQTLAAGLGREERFEEAAELLREGISRRAGDLGLVVQRAYYFERAGRAAEATEALAGLPTGEARSESTARLRYTEGPTAALAPVRGRLAQSLPALLPRLSRALDALSPEGDAEP